MQLLSAMDLKPQADELSSTVDTILSATTLPTQRSQAHQKAEAYKTQLDPSLQFQLSNFIINELTQTH